MLKKYLISLDKDIQRRELFFSQKNTEDFQIFSASVNVTTLSHLVEAKYLPSVRTRRLPVKLKE